MTKTTTTDRLALTFEVAATPERVEQIARMFKEALAGASDSPVAESVTLVVENYSMKARLNAWDARGEEATARIGRVIVSPLKELKERPASQKIAEALAKYGRDLSSLGGILTIWGEKDSIPLDESFVSTMEGASKKHLPESDVLVGDSSLYGTAIRVGRLSESKALSARLNVDGKLHEIVVGNLPEEQSKILFDGVRLGNLLRLGIQGKWLRSEKRWILDTGSMKISSVELIEPISGKDLLEKLSGAIEPTTAQEFKEMMEELQE